jgi:hypothetical protein
VVVLAEKSSSVYTELDLPANMHPCVVVLAGKLSSVYTVNSQFSDTPREGVTKSSLTVFILLHPCVIVLDGKCISTWYWWKNQAVYTELDFPTNMHPCVVVLAGKFSAGVTKSRVDCTALSSQVLSKFVFFLSLQLLFVPFIFIRF